MVEVAADVTPPVKNQHVITRTLLGRFASPTAGGAAPKLVSFHLARGIGKPRPTRNIGVIEDFLSIGSGSAEKLWGTIENRLPQAIRACENGTVWHDSALVRVVKDAIALHFVRSVQVLVVHERSWRDSRAESDRELRSNPALLERVFTQRFGGLLPAGPESVQVLLDDLHAESTDIVTSGAWLRARVEELFEGARAFVGRHELQLARPAKGEFLIGDIPALTLRQGYPGVGVLGGVALGDATTAFMPLGPKLVAALNSTPEDVTVGPDVVDAINSRQIVGAYERVYFRTGSGLDAFVRKVRPPTVAGLPAQSKR